MDRTRSVQRILLREDGTLSRFVVAFCLALGLAAVCASARAPWVLPGSTSCAQTIPSPTPTRTPTTTPTRRALLLPIILRGWPVLPPTPTPTPTPYYMQLIVNPSFETDEAWEIPKTAYSAGYSIGRARTGSRSMRLGIDTGGNVWSWSSARQRVDIPSGITHAQLSFYYFPVSAWADDDTIYFCVLRASDNTILGKCTFWIERNQAWNLGTFDLVGYAGQSIKVHFGVRNDGLNGISAVYLDDVTLYVW